MGGFLEEGKRVYGAKDYIKSTGLVVTFLVNFPHEQENIKRAKKWEKRYEATEVFNFVPYLYYLLYNK